MTIGRRKVEGGRESIERWIQGARKKKTKARKKYICYRLLIYLFIVVCIYQEGGLWQVFFDYLIVLNFDFNEF